MRKKLLFAGIGILFLAIAVYVVLPYLKPKKDYLRVSGRVEADETELSAQVPGKLVNVFIRDGSTVRKGDIIAAIDDRELQSKQRETIDRIAELNESIKAAELNLEYTAKSIEHSIDEAKKLLSVASARLKQAEAKRANAEKELKRYMNLMEKEVISKQKFDSIKLTFDLSQEETNIANKEVERAKVAWKKAEDTRILAKAKEREILALRKSTGQLRENLQQVELNIGYSQITAPSDGIILRKVAEPGEVIARGGVVGIMINPADIHVRTYIPEKFIGSMRMDMQADVFADAYPGKPVHGYVCYISDKSEFTPKEVQSYEERVKQVFAVKVCFAPKDGPSEKGKAYQEILKKGMPVDVRFAVKQAVEN